MYVPDRFKAQGMCIKVVEVYPSQLWNVPDHLKTQGMCEIAVRGKPWLLEYVPDHVETQEMCDSVVIEDLWLLRYVPHWFVTQQQVKLRDNHFIDDGYIKWYDGYPKCKAQKAQIKK